MKKIRIFKRVWSLCAPYQKYLLSILALLFVNNVLQAIFPLVLGLIVTAITNSDKYTFIVVIVVWLVLVLTRTSINYFRERFELKNIDFELSRHLSRISMEKFFNISMGQHQTGHSLIRRSIVSKGEAAVTGTVNMGIYDLIPTSLMILVPAAFLMVNLPIVGLFVLLVIVVFTAYTLWYVSSYVPKLRLLDTMINRVGKKHGEFTSNSEVVFVNAQEERVKKECDDANFSLEKIGVPLWLSYLDRFYSGQWGLALCQSSCIALIGYLTFKGEINAGMFVTVSMWASAAIGTLGNVNNIQRNLTKNLAPLLKYFRFLDYESDIVISPHPILLGRIQGKIEFRDVSFTYRARTSKDILNDEILEGDEDDNDGGGKSSEIPTLQNISFTLEAGRRYAFVGRSGAGKSTLVGLMLRAFDTQSGHILVDGVDIRMLDFRELRRHIGLVPQDVALFDGTLKYNVTFGMNGSADKVTTEELERIAKLSRVSEFFNNLEKGWDTVIGERGIKLSGGQRQRVGIARALIKDPQILIFDEATSSLDTENEARIRESIREASAGKTTIIIAHRLATVRDADEILVFDEGKLVGQGTHTDLLSVNAHYQRLVQNQVILG